MSLMKYTALELGELIRKREVSVAEAARAAVEAAENDETNSFITVLNGEADKTAEEVQKKIDAGELTSPLAGVPVSIKDNICTAGVKTTCASKMLEGFIPPYDACAVEKLKNAGAVMAGKLNMDEFAMGSTSETSYFGEVKNPWDPEKVPGGSSGGAASSVASQTSFYALGSDTGGSIRQPCSFCGATGIKPTYGTVSRYGLIAYASSLDQIGPIARDARDAAAVLDVIAGRDARDSTSVDSPSGFLSSLTGDVKGLKIGIPSNWYSDGLDQDVKSRVLDAVEKFRQLGADVEEFEMPSIEYAVPAYYIIASAEAASNLSRYDGVKYGFRAENYDDLIDMYVKSRSEGFGSEVKRRIMIGNFVLSSGYYDAYYKKALKVKAVIKNDFDRAFEKYDMIVSPAAPNTAPKIGESLSDPLKMYLGDIYTVSVNLAGLPGLTAPCGFDNSGMPVGMQLIGAAFSEKTLLNAAFAYQSVTDFHKMKAGGLEK